MGEWANDIDMSELRQLADDLWLIEEIPMDRITELCNEHVIDCYKFVSAWHKLMDEMHRVMNTTEERMEALPTHG